MRVLIADELAPIGIERLRERHDVDVRTGLDHAALVAAIGDYDAIVVRSRTTVDAEVIDAADRLKVVGRAGIGIDNIDVDAATRHGILVCNVPQSNVVSAAEHTVAIMLSLLRRVPQADASVRAGRWERSRFAGTELSHKVLGVLGLGRVGRLVVERCRGFGVDVLAYDPYVTAEAAGKLGVELIDDLDELCARADLLTIHLPRTEETEGIVGEAQLRALGPSGYLVNVARGGLVDEALLARALEQGWIAGAALDVYESEPLGESPLRGLDNVVLTPHLGASTTEAQDRASRMVADAVIQALDGELVPGAVNVPVTAGLPDRLLGYLPLARHLGRVCNTLRATAVDELVVELSGSLADDRGHRDPLALAALIGMLADVVDRPVTYVNATDIARERGLSLSTKLSPADDRPPVLRLRAGEVEVAGTLTWPGDKPRVTEIWGYDVDVEPADHMVFVRYVDRPGVIGSIGALFGEAGVNIAGMQVARREAGGEALMVMSVDSAVPADVLEAAAEAVGASDVRTLPPSRPRATG